ncbi:MAG TPA: hypothetical protein VHM90_04120, partial [Phycisphaerae bacterium]|nr:hypothetical protein [Phycisphaerae bacterium]
AETTNYVGKINWTFDRSNSSNAGLDAIIPGNTVSTFCIEGTQNVFINQNANFANIFSDISQAPKDNVGSAYVMGSAKATALNLFWDAYYDQTTSNVNAAAFQMGIWEILYDGGSTDLTSGLFKAAPTASSDSQQAYLQAQLWLSNYGNVTAGTHYQLYAFSDPNLQDQLFGVPTPPSGASPTPLPAGLPAGLGLMGALGLWKRVKAKK